MKQDSTDNLEEGLLVLIRSVERISCCDLGLFLLNFQKIRKLRVIRSICCKNRSASSRIVWRVASHICSVTGCGRFLLSRVRLKEKMILWMNLLKIMQYFWTPSLYCSFLVRGGNAKVLSIPLSLNIWCLITMVDFKEFRS